MGFQRAYMLCVLASISGDILDDIAESTAYAISASGDSNLGRDLAFGTRLKPISPFSTFGPGGRCDGIVSYRVPWVCPSTFESLRHSTKTPLMKLKDDVVKTTRTCSGEAVECGGGFSMTAEKDVALVEALKGQSGVDYGEVVVVVVAEVLALCEVRKGCFAA